MSIQDDPNLAGDALNERLWRARALKAESDNASLRARCEALEDANRELEHFKNTAASRGTVITDVRFENEAEWLRSQSLDVVTSYLKTCTSKLFNLDGDERVAAPAGANGLSADAMASIELACVGATDPVTLKAALIAAQLDVSKRTSAGSH